MVKDWVTFKLSELDKSLLKVLSDWFGGRDARNSHNALELARLYVLWFLLQLKRLPVILKYVVPSVPKDVKEVTVEYLKALLGHDISQKVKGRSKFFVPYDVLNKGMKDFDKALVLFGFTI